MYYCMCTDSYNINKSPSPSSSVKLIDGKESVTDDGPYSGVGVYTLCDCFCTVLYCVLYATNAPT